MGLKGFLPPVLLLSVSVLEPVDNRIAWLVLTALCALCFIKSAIKFSTIDGIIAAGTAYLTFLALANSGSAEIILRELRMLSYLYFSFKLAQVVDWERSAGFLLTCGMAICLVFILDGTGVVRFWTYKHVAEYQSYIVQGPSLTPLYLLLVFWGFRRLNTFQMLSVCAASCLAAYFSGTLQNLVTFIVLTLISGPLLSGVFRFYLLRVAIISGGVSLFVAIYILTFQSIMRGTPIDHVNASNAHVSKLQQVANVTASGTFRTRVMDTHQSLSSLSSAPLQMLVGSGIGFNTIVIRYEHNSSKQQERQFLEIDNGWVYILNRAGVGGLVLIMLLLHKILTGQSQNAEGMKIATCIVIFNFLSIHMFSTATVALLLGAYFAKTRTAHIPSARY